MNLISYYRKKLASWLLPHACVLCGGFSQRNQDLCAACYHDLPQIEHPCVRCARPKATAIEVECGNCLVTPPFFDRTHALFAYQQPLTRLIMDLKFGQALINARLLGELLANKIQTFAGPLPDAILPVPLHTKRIRERGFNQAIEIAKALNHSLKLPLLLTAVKRGKYTMAQATLKAEERQQNIKNAFQIVKPIPFQHIAIVDDVITTGSTINELSYILKKAGVKRIDIWCCARATY